MSAPVTHPRWKIVCAACCLAIAGALSACKRERLPSPQSGPLPVNVVAAVEREITEWDEFTGRTAAVEFVEIRPRVSGYLTEIHFKAGDLVEKGTPLFTIDPRPYQADLDRATAALEEAQAQLRLADVEFGRAESLRKKGVLSPEEFDQKSAALKQSEASVRAGQAARDAAALNLGFTRIESPIGGRVSDPRVTVGNLVQASAAGGDNVLTTVVSVDPLYVYADADENAVLRFMEQHAVGERRSTRDGRIPAYVQLANEEGFPHEGYVDFADNRLDPGTGTLRLRGVFKSWDPLLAPGFFVRMRIPVGQPKPALLIPDEVISSQQGIRFVFVVKPDHTIERRNIETGGLHEGLRIVRSGLNAGDLVVSTRLQMLRPGMPVQPVPTAATPEPAATAQPPAPANEGK